MARELNNKFSWKTATFMAKLSYYSYAGEDEFNKQFKKQWANIEFFDKGGTQCFVLHCPKNYVVVFRGTEPTSWEDIKADIQFTKQKKEYQPSKTGHGSVGKIHRGFRDALNDVWPDLISHYNYHAKGKQLLVTGHSLGAALATLVAGRLNNPDVVLYTYGSPRVGNGKWNKCQKFKHYRFRNNNDLVTRIPPAWLGFKHNGKFMYFNSNGDHKDQPGFFYMLTHWFGGTIKGILTFSFDSFSDHNINTYYKLCKQKEMN